MPLKFLGTQASNHALKSLSENLTKQCVLDYYVRTVLFKCVSEEGKLRM